MNDADSIPTRQSLLARLKDVGDQESWRVFFDIYWRLIHATALKAGLTETEAQEVVQEVMIGAAKKMPEFTYDPGKDSLKGWLLAVTRWKVADQFRRREKVGQPSRLPRSGETPDLLSNDTARTATVERVPDPRGAEIDAIWDAEWRSNLLRAARNVVASDGPDVESQHGCGLLGETPCGTVGNGGTQAAQQP